MTDLKTIYCINHVLNFDTQQLSPINLQWKRKTPPENGLSQSAIANINMSHFGRMCRKWPMHTT